jgi:anti-sigma B factor antagonist
MAASGPDIRASRDQVVVTLHGELDIVSAPTALVALVAAAIRGQSVVVDLAEVDFLDCGTVRSLMLARIVAQEAGGEVTLINSRRGVQRLLTILGHAAAVPAAIEAARDSQMAGEREANGNGARTVVVTM